MYSEVLNCIRKLSDLWIFNSRIFTFRELRLDAVPYIVLSHSDKYNIAAYSPIFSIRSILITSYLHVYAITILSLVLVFPISRLYFVYSRYHVMVPACLLLLYRIIDGAGQLFGEPKVTSREPCPKLVYRTFLSFVWQFTSTYIGFRWFSRNASCSSFPQVEKCAGNARAFSSMIKGLNPRSFARNTTLILSTTPSEPATRQAINSCTALRLHDCLAQISSVTMQSFTCRRLPCSDKIWRL